MSEPLIFNMYRVRQKNLPKFEALQLSYFFSKNEIKILQDSVFTLQSRLVIFLTAVKYYMRNGTISLTSQIASLFMNTVSLTVEDRCLVKCLRVEKRLECFPNDAWISPEKVEKRTLNYLIRKIDKTGSADRASDSGRHHSTSGLGFCRQKPVFAGHVV